MAEAEHRPAREHLETLFREFPALNVVYDLERSLTLPEHFYINLLDEDDWSFIIKLQALLEAAVTHAIIRGLDDARIKPILTKLTYGNRTTGKLAFAAQLGVFDKPQLLFLQKLSELRNAYAHNVEYVGLSLVDFFQSLVPDARSGFYSAFRWGYNAVQDVPVRIDEDTYDITQVSKALAVACVDDLPTFSIWQGALICLRAIHLHTSVSELRSGERDLMEYMYATLMGERASEAAAGNQPEPPA